MVEERKYCSLHRGTEAMKQYTDETAGEKGGCSEAAIRAKERHG